MSDPTSAVSHAGPRHPLIRVFDCHVCRTRSNAIEFLLLRRAAAKIYAGSWRMVGGKLRTGETAWQGCLRELAEETKLEIRRLITVPYVNRFYEWQHDRINDIPVFLAVVDANAEPTLDDEHVESRWVPAARARKMLPWPAQRDGMLAAETMLREGGPLIEFLEVQLPSSQS